MSVFGSRSSSIDSENEQCNNHTPSMSNIKKDLSGNIFYVRNINKRRMRDETVSKVIISPSPTPESFLLKMKTMYG